MIVCNLCKSITSGETTVGSMLKEADALRREARSETKLIQAMEKYNAAWNALNNSHKSHEECIETVNKDYQDVFRSIQGSRA